jgi:hypothetical protein
MNFDEYESLLRKRLGTYFDFKTDVPLDDRVYPLVAEHTARLEQTVLGKDNVVDYYDTYEYCVLSRHERVDGEGVSRELDRAKSLVSALSRPCRTHKSTLITRILAVESPLEGEVTGGASEYPALRSMIKTFRHTKTHRFFFHGWTDVRVYLVDLATAEVVASPRGKRDLASFVPIA